MIFPTKNGNEPKCPSFIFLSTHIVCISTVFICFHTFKWIYWSCQTIFPWPQTSNHGTGQEDCNWSTYCHTSLMIFADNVTFDTIHGYLRTSRIAQEITYQQQSNEQQDKSFVKNCRVINCALSLIAPQWEFPVKTSLKLVWVWQSGWSIYKWLVSLITLITLLKCLQST